MQFPGLRDVGRLDKVHFISVQKSAGFGDAWATVARNWFVVG